MKTNNKRFSTEIEMEKLSAIAIAVQCRVEVLALAVNKENKHRIGKENKSLLLAGGHDCVSKDSNKIYK